MYYTNFDTYILMVGLSFPLSVIVVIYIGWLFEWKRLKNLKKNETKWNKKEDIFIMSENSLRRRKDNED